MRNIIIISVGLFVANVALGQIKFFNYYSNNGADMGQGIVQLEDSSYVITGSSSSFTEGPSQAFLMKIDSMGNYLWSNHYGGSEIESGRRVLYKQNVGFYICGFTNSIGNGGFDFYLAKTDPNGNPEWEKSYGDYGWEKVHDAALTKDTGIIMVGETSSNATDNLDIFIVRTDINGDTLWTKTIGGAGDDFATCIRQFNDSTYVIGGHRYVEDSLQTKAYLTYINDDGTVYWEDIVGGDNGNYWVNDICFSNGNILAVGGTEGPGSNGIDVFACYEDMAGFYGGGTSIVTANDHENQLITTFGPINDLFIAYSFIEELTAADGPDAIVAKYEGLSFTWQNEIFIEHEFADVSGQLIRTSDGGAILVGYSTGVVSGGNEIFAMKIGPDATYPDVTNPTIDEVVIVVEQELMNDVLVYPNPGSTIVNVKTENGNYSQIRLLNSLGQLILDEDFSFYKTIDISENAEGWYVLEIIGDGFVTVRKKVIIKH